MNVKVYLKVLYKKLWLVILVPFIAAGATCFICKFAIKPVYESTQSFYVINTNRDTAYPIGGYDAVMVDQQLLRDYRELIKSNYVTDAVLNKLFITTKTREEVKKRVNVILKNETRILEIKVQDKDPVLAKRLAETFGEVFVEQAKSWMKIESISIIDRAEIPDKPIKPDLLLYTLIASITGFLAAMGIIFFMEYLDDSIRFVEDIERYTGTVVIATIPEFKIK